MNRVEFEAVANNSGAMEAETIYQNGRSAKSHKSSVNFLKRACFALLAACIIFSGCSKDEDKNDGKTIDAKLIGKWEMISMTYNDVQYDLPYPASPIGLSSAGYEYTKNTYKYFVNGSVYQELSGVYSEKNQNYISTGISFGYTWEVSDDILTIIRNDGISASMVCEKVSKFSWE